MGPPMSRMSNVSSDVKNIHQKDFFETRVKGINKHARQSEKPILNYIGITVSRDNQTGQVYLREPTFTFNSIGNSSTYNICQVSSCSFLLSDYEKKSVAILDTSSSDVYSINLPGNTGHLCKVNQSLAAVWVSKEESFAEVYLLDIRKSLSILSSFEVEENCFGMTGINEKLYLAKLNCISVFSLDGKNTKTFFQQRENAQIVQMTGGPFNTCLCVCKNISELVWVTLNAKGDCLKTIYSKTTKISDFPPNCLMVDTDTAGNAYTCYRDNIFSRITPEGIENVYNLPLNVKAMCYDKENEMVAFLTDAGLVLYSFDKVSSTLEIGLLSVHFI